ncbi:hypothetical protein PR002_g3737 [Phytophthora rubi]|uniref:Uncharacterized protein n=1 Tax=Phytophthora rubi TaxID=129364 RepID=A0A6A3NMB7_9STRA|nr:hypothetical protein PR002_g3737 [Phytophthora rubi]
MTSNGGIPAQPTKEQAKRGRPSKNDSDVWTEEATETLFTVRYVTAKEESKRARNYVEVGAVWVLVRC